MTLEGVVTGLGIGSIYNVVFGMYYRQPLSAFWWYCIGVICLAKGAA